MTKMILYKSISQNEYTSTLIYSYICFCYFAWKDEQNFAYYARDNKIKTIDVLTS